MAEIHLAGPERIGDLRPLWLELRHHHQPVSRVQPFVDDETSWDARCQSYVDTFTDGGFAVLAEEDGELLGYATVRVHDEPQDSCMIGVMEGNDAARRLYERRGLVPGWLQLYRVTAGPPPG
jgi:hypothetical protein